MIGDNIKKYMKLRGFKQEELAKKVGISTVYLSYVINNKRTASVEVIEKIAQALEVPVDELFKEEQEDQSNPEEEALKYLTEEDRIMFKKFKALSPEDAKKILEIIDVFEKENGD